MRTPAAVCLCLALAACSARHAGSGLQQWTDEQGNVRYTTSSDQVPRGRRDTLSRVEPGRSAEQNAALTPGARTEPVPPPSAAEWLRGEQPEDAAAAPSAPVPVADVPASADAIDRRIRGLENDIAEAQTELEQTTAAAPPAEEAHVQAVTQRLSWLQEQLEAARAQRAALPPTGN